MHKPFFFISFVAVHNMYTWMWSTRGWSTNLYSDLLLVPYDNKREVVVGVVGDESDRYFHNIMTCLTCWWWYMSSHLFHRKLSVTARSENNCLQNHQFKQRLRLIDSQIVSPLIILSFDWLIDNQWDDYTWRNRKPDLILTKLSHIFLL
jgi:hypothetical protein